MFLIELGRIGNRAFGVDGKKNVLVAAKTYTEAASSVPDVIAGVMIHPVCYRKGYAVEEHVTREISVSLG